MKTSPAFPPFFIKTSLKTHRQHSKYFPSSLQHFHRRRLLSGSIVATTTRLLSAELL
jgi:hypothetical protein